MTWTDAQLRTAYESLSGVQLRAADAFIKKAAAAHAKRISDLAPARISGGIPADVGGLQTRRQTGPPGGLWPWIIGGGVGLLILAERRR